MKPPRNRPECSMLRMCVLMGLMALIWMQSQTLAEDAPQPPGLLAR